MKNKSDEPDFLVSKMASNGWRAGFSDSLGGGKKNLCSLLLIVVGIVIRAYMCVNHFTSCDDLGVAFTILRGEEGAWSVYNCIHGFKSFLDYPWTYAPLQFLFTSLFLSCDLSYQWVLILGRFPSFLCSVAALILFAYLLINGQKKFDFQENKTAGLMSITLFSLSYENIIYAGQMESYAIGVLFSVVMIWLLVYNREEFHFLQTTILIVLAGYGQYQCFILVMAFYIAVFLMAILRKKVQKKEIIKIFMSAAVSFVCYLPLLKRFININMGSRGIMWNVGDNNQFLYSISDKNPIEIIRYTLTFFARNTFLVIKSMLIPIKVEFLANGLGVVMCIFVLVGLISLHRSVIKQIAWYIDASVLVYMALIMMGKLTLSPSRHMLIMVPVMLICIYFGVSVFLSVLKNYSWQKFLGKGIIYGITVLIVVLFVYELPEEISLRKNKITGAEYYSDLMDKYSPDAIMTVNYVFEPYVMSKLSDGLPYEIEFLTGMPYIGYIFNDLNSSGDDIHNIIIVGPVRNEDAIINLWKSDKNPLREMYGPEYGIGNIRILEEDTSYCSDEYAIEFRLRGGFPLYSIYGATVNYTE